MLVGAIVASRVVEMAQPLQTNWMCHAKGGTLYYSTVASSPLVELLLTISCPSASAGLLLVTAIVCGK